MTFTVADMSGLNLGAFSPTQITLDADAAGRGWYLDGTPLDDAEFGTVFAATWMQTDPTAAPAGHYDLLTTIMHEMGHALGLGDSYASADRGDADVRLALHRRAAAAGRRRRRRCGRGLDRRGGVPRCADRHRRAAGGQDRHHPVAGDHRPAEQPAHRQSPRTKAGFGHQRGRLPRRQHQYRHHRARHADPRRHGVERQRHRRRHRRQRYQGRGRAGRRQHHCSRCSPTPAPRRRLDAATRRSRPRQPRATATTPSPGWRPATTSCASTLATSPGSALSPACRFPLPPRPSRRTRTTTSTTTTTVRAPRPAGLLARDHARLQHRANGGHRQRHQHYARLRLHRATAGRPVCDQDGERCDAQRRRPDHLHRHAVQPGP